MAVIMSEEVIVHLLQQSDCGFVVVCLPRGSTQSSSHAVTVHEQSASSIVVEARLLIGIPIVITNDRPAETSQG